MSGTVLSTLCSICHTDAPKYKCPRCSARTCSVGCIQKHKSRADCDGIRNPRAFLPLAQLKTDAGIDHDFNFLSSIERARQRAEKDLVEGRQLLTETELRPQNDTKAFRKVWYGDEMRHLPAQGPQYKKFAGPQDGASVIDGFDKHVRRRLRFLDIEAVTMPKGMARQKDNRTAYNRRTQSINWQVEWLVYNAADLGALAPQDQQQPLRILHKTLDGTPLVSGLASALDWHRGQLDRQARENLADADNERDMDEDGPSPKKKRKTARYNQPVGQDFSTTAWASSAPYTIQNTATSAWSSTTTAPQAETTVEEDLARRWRFYLVKASRTTADPKRRTTAPTAKNTTSLIPLASTETLVTALTGRTIVEFPTVVVVPVGVEIPHGYILGTAERRTTPAVHCKNRDTDEGHRSGNPFKRPFDSPSGPHVRGGRSGRGGGPYGRGGKRARVEYPARQVREGLPVEMDVEERSEAEEGEVESEGDEGFAGGASWERASSITLGREEEETGAGVWRGGLVDYGSDEED